MMYEEDMRRLQEDMPYVISLDDDDVYAIYLTEPCKSIFPSNIEALCDTFNPMDGLCTTINKKFNRGLDGFPVQNDHWLNSECGYGCAECSDDLCEVPYEPVFINNEGVAALSQAHDCGFGCTNASGTPTCTRGFEFNTDSPPVCELIAEQFNSTCGLGCTDCRLTQTNERRCYQCVQPLDEEIILELSSTGRCELFIEGYEEYEMFSSPCGIGCSVCD